MSPNRGNIHDSQGFSCKLQLSDIMRLQRFHSDFVRFSKLHRLLTTFETFQTGSYLAAAPYSDRFGKRRKKSRKVSNSLWSPEKYLWSLIKSDKVQKLSRSLADLLQENIGIDHIYADRIWSRSEMLLCECLSIFVMLSIKTSWMLCCHHSSQKLLVNHQFHLNNF